LYHWGCTATSTAIVEELERRGYAVHRVPISGLYRLREGPASPDEFDDPDVFRRFTLANPWLWRELLPVDQVVVNGEGSLHGLNDYVLKLLYVAYAAKRWLSKRVQIVNHSCYPDGAREPADSEAWRLYRKVYGAMDHVVVREPSSHALLERAGVASTLGGDCLPLHVRAHHRSPPSTRAGAILAGSVAAGTGQVTAYGAFVDAMIAQGTPVTFLTGANLLPAVDEDRFLRALRERAPGLRVVEADSVREWLAVLADAAVVVSGRFHHTLAAASLGTPFVLLDSNTPKNAGLARMLSAPEPIRLGSPTLAEEMIAATRGRLATAPTTPTLDALCQLALENFGELPALVT
jgi:polysaccharide pyruvyl transferase WcaK-like protein